MENKEICQIPTRELLEKRFSFIDNDILRSNIAIAFQYIIFLITLESETKLPGAIYYSIYKNMIFYTACIVESCIHYVIKKFIDEDIVKANDIMPGDWGYKQCKEIYQISSDKRVCGVIKYKIVEKFNDSTQFQKLNRASQKAGILNQDLFDKSDSLRKKRNRIHLAGLEEPDDLYSKKDTEIAFSHAKDIINHLEKKLTELQNK